MKLWINCRHGLKKFLRIIRNSTVGFLGGIYRMINNWQIPRNKRQLYPVVDILALFNLHSIGQIWKSDVARQLNFELELERYGLKRTGSRRDQRGGGARTYESWLFNLGLIFNETDTGISRLTLAGEALLNGEPPVPIITNQLMKLQYPSPYSIRRGVDINQRFRIRPFRFILRLLADARIQTLTNREIGLFLATEGENESIGCFEHIIAQILRFRREGLDMLPPNFNEIYASSKSGVRTLEATIKSLVQDNANTFINYLEYTGLIERASGTISIARGREIDVHAILNDGTTVRSIVQKNRYAMENYQRSYGLAPGQVRDNRNFANAVVTEGDYRNRRIRNEYLRITRNLPVVELNATLYQQIATVTGYTLAQIEQALHSIHVHTLDEYETQYLTLGSSGTDFATEFEVATTHIFTQLGFVSEHIGAQPLNPDIHIMDGSNNINGIIDTKAYAAYSINNDHRNRMLHNYIPTFSHESSLDFFMYVADGFIGTIDSQINRISNDSGVSGSAITSRLLLQLLARHLQTPISKIILRDLFMVNRQITLADIDEITV